MHLPSALKTCMHILNALACNFQKIHLPSALKTCMHILKAALNNLPKTMQNMGFGRGGSIYIYILSIVKCTIYCWYCCDYVAFWLFVTDIGLNLHLVSSPMPSATPATPLRVQSAHHEWGIESLGCSSSTWKPELGRCRCQPRHRKTRGCVSFQAISACWFTQIYLFCPQTHKCSQIKYIDRYR